LEFQERGFGLTPTDPRALAFDYAEVNNILNNFNKTLKLASQDWCYGFRQRPSRKLSLRKPQAFSLARAQCMNRPAVGRYFDILKKELIRLDIVDKPEMIYNCDESGLSLVPDTKIVKGKRDVHQITSGDHLQR